MLYHPSDPNCKNRKKKYDLGADSSQFPYIFMEFKEPSWSSKTSSPSGPSPVGRNCVKSGLKLFHPKAQLLRESRGGRPGLSVPNIPYRLC